MSFQCSMMISRKQSGFWPIHNFIMANETHFVFYFSQFLFLCCCSFPASVFPSFEYLSLKTPRIWVWWTPIDMFIACSFLSRSRESKRDGGGVINVAGRLGLKRSRQSSAAAVLKIDFSYAILPNVCD